ncbi:hypothetical protein BCON_0254g00130 [Botryotinia convoluta]|uniref:Uncharacterized protein n=1 Tax=Botryotinia convoluta TaxID=54673 RepID=A0A4Z1HHT9_9HELO|nr:hypothetical protein BCON_0254g00130 [Botryotinia convoluta]
MAPNLGWLLHGDNLILDYGCSAINTTLIGKFAPVQQGACTFNTEFEHALDADYSYGGAKPYPYLTSVAQQGGEFSKIYGLLLNAYM